MSVTDLTVTEAHARQLQGATLIDVRSTREFAAGHATGAVNIPLLEPDEDTDQMLPNPDFVRVVTANFAPDTPLLLSCQAGGRSSRAAKMLESFGFSNIVKVVGGFCGSRPGQPVNAGWEQSGLPVESATQPGHAYEDLLGKADLSTNT
jgi:rhodanese-related sulfurtransferase